jgi:hypothetical protein
MRRFELMREMCRKVENVMEHFASRDATTRQILLMELWVETNFRPPKRRTSWGVFEDSNILTKQRDRSLTLRRAIWDETREWRRLEELDEEPDVLEPILSIVEVPVNQEKFNKLWDESKQISIPFRVEPYFGFDGEFRGLRMGSAFDRVSFGWWSIGPEEWHPMTAWANKMLRFLDREIIKHRQKLKLEGKDL